MKQAPKPQTYNIAPNIEWTYDAPSANVSLPLVVQVDRYLLCAQPRLVASECFEHAAECNFNVILAEPAPSKVVGAIIWTLATTPHGAHGAANTTMAEKYHSFTGVEERFHSSHPIFVLRILASRIFKRVHESSFSDEYNSDHHNTGRSLKAN